MSRFEPASTAATGTGGGRIDRCAAPDASAGRWGDYRVRAAFRSGMQRWKWQVIWPRDEVIKEVSWSLVHRSRFEMSDAVLS
jgi:hypothetical protein